MGGRTVRPGWSAQRHPRASAIIMPVRCIASGAEGTVSHPELREFRSIICILTATALSRVTVVAMRTVIRCVASRNTQRVSYWPSGGENSSLRVPSGTLTDEKAGTRRQRKFSLAPPPRRQGRRCKASRRARQNFSAKKSAASLRPRSPHGGRRYPPRQAAIRRSTRRDCVFR